MMGCDCPKCLKAGPMLAWEDRDEGSIPIREGRAIVGSRASVKVGTGASYQFFQGRQPVRNFSINCCCNGS